VLFGRDIFEILEILLINKLSVKVKKRAGGCLIQDLPPGPT
jgi:hypothetical protein